MKPAGMLQEENQDGKTVASKTRRLSQKIYFLALLSAVPGIYGLHTRETPVSATSMIRIWTTISRFGRILT